MDVQHGEPSGWTTVDPSVLFSYCSKWALGQCALASSGPCTWFFSCTSQDEGRRMEYTSCTVRLKLGVLPVSPHLHTALQIALISLRQNKADAKAAARARDSKQVVRKSIVEAGTYCFWCEMFQSKFIICKKIVSAEKRPR